PPSPRLPARHRPHPPPPSVSPGHAPPHDPFRDPPRTTTGCSTASATEPSELDRGQAPHPGIEPGLAASKTAVRPPHPRGEPSVLARSPTWSSTLEGSRAVRHTPGAQTKPTAGLEPA